jgi:hypothetical protein
MQQKYQAIPFPVDVISGPRLLDELLAFVIQPREASSERSDRPLASLVHDESLNHFLLEPWS